MARKRKVVKKTPPQVTIPQKETLPCPAGGDGAVISIQPPEGVKELDEAKPKPPEPRILYPGRDFYHEFACPACGHEKSGFSSKPEPITNPRGKGGEQWGRFTCEKCGCVWAAAPKGE